ncbi:GtrA family protein [Undibacterium sp. CY18W]|uniref:GtrA family protein n=1 Tax=Undibacterium hunanense TaxID=2762292 RepID=A0ABR6ZL04_9BURK|nr:GtrA family protein [Undibacterium hunanense]MBC3916578.1 GtrA family protein [Undibacterium hunanense]
MVIKELIKFAMVGLCGTATQYITLWLGVEYLHISPTICSATGYLLGSLLNYALNYFFTFESDGEHLSLAPKYFAVLGVGFLFNVVAMWFLTSHLQVNYWISQIFITGIVFLWNFMGSKIWVFK